MIVQNSSVQACCKRRKSYFEEIKRESAPRFLIEQIGDTAGALMRSKERDNYLSPPAQLAFEPLADFGQREIVAEVRAQLIEVQARCMKA